MNRLYRRGVLAAGVWLAVCLTITSAAAAEPVRLAPIHRTSLLVQDLDRSLTLYRDVLGLELGRVTETPADSYSYRFFNIPPGSMRRFAYLSGEGAYSNVLGLGEAPDVELQPNSGTRSVAYVQTVADVTGIMAKVRAMGLEIIEPVEFMSREAGLPGIEFGVIDFDGHLLLLYGLLPIED